jgi:hypothetical protein
VASAHSQGTISVLNGTYSFARTNATAFGGTEGNTSPALGGFYYGVFTASSTITSIDPNLQDLLGPNWTFTGVYATNTAIASGGRLNGGLGVTALQGWTPGVTNSYLLLGWSASIAGEDWSSVSNQLRGATFSFGSWCLPHTIIAQAAFLGVTSIGFGEAGGGTTGLPPFPLFGQTPNPAGNPISTPFDLYALSLCPEPATPALMFFGVAALLAWRRARSSLRSVHPLSPKEWGRASRRHDVRRGSP